MQKSVFAVTNVNKYMRSENTQNYAPMMNKNFIFKEICLQRIYPAISIKSRRSQHVNFISGKQCMHLFFVGVNI